MHARLLTVASAALVVGLALACGGTSDPSGPAPEPEVEPAPAADPVPTEPALEGYAYLPGPDGKAAGARFSRFEPGADVFIGVDGANLRPAVGSKDVVAELRLGEAAVVKSVESDPVELIGRRNVWYRIEVAGKTGVIFGSILTPFGGDYWPNEGDDAVRWAATFSPDGKPRLRVEKEAEGEVWSIDLEPTERFTGGSLKAEPAMYGDFETYLDVSLCREDGGDEPRCSSATARIDIDTDALVQITPPDPWRYLPDPSAAAECEPKARLIPIELFDADEAQAEAVESFEIPQYMRGPGGAVDCFAVGKVKKGAHVGKELVSCVLGGPGKAGPDEASVGRYLRDSATWTLLPCASHDWHGGDVHGELMQRRKKVVIDGSIQAPSPLRSPPTLPIEKGTLTLAWRSPYRVAASSAPDDSVKTPFGPAVDIGESDEVPDNAFVLDQPDGTSLLYQWKPDLAMEGDKLASYSAETTGCDGSPSVFVNVIPDAFATFEAFGTLKDGSEVRKLPGSDHPEAERLVELYKELSTSGMHRPTLKLDQTPEALVASDAFLYIEHPLGGTVRLIRNDLQTPAMCEPILYVYADPPRRVSIAPGEGLRFFKTLPFGPDGWTGVAQPDGSVWVDGERWPELFWEGRSRWFAPPRQQIVVAPDALEPVLRDALEQQGLVDSEIDAFLDAWLPDLDQEKNVRLGFHTPETIERVAPLDVHPPPDATIRVLLDAHFTDASPSGRLELPSPPARERYTVVEWGGILREGAE